MDELPGSFLPLVNPDGFEGLILIRFPSQMERLTSRVTSRLTVENTADDL